MMLLVACVVTFILTAMLVGGSWYQVSFKKNFDLQLESIPAARKCQEQTSNPLDQSAGPAPPPTCTPNACGNAISTYKTARPATLRDVVGVYKACAEADGTTDAHGIGGVHVKFHSFF